MKKPVLLFAAILFVLAIGVVTFIPNPVERVQKEIEKFECVRLCQQADMEEQSQKPCSAMCQGEVWFNGPEENLEQIDAIEIERDNSFKQQ